MRTREVLVEGFEEVKILFQYLYMNEDHNIDISNGITKLSTKLAENLEVLQMNLSFPHLGYTCRDMRIGEWASLCRTVKRATL